MLQRCRQAGKVSAFLIHKKTPLWLLVCRCVVQVLLQEASLHVRRAVATGLCMSAAATAR
jgi:hypothetical protein